MFDTEETVETVVTPVTVDTVPTVVTVLSVKLPVMLSIVTLWRCCGSTAP